nr:EOG090X081J [Artemia franciscana]
MDTFTSFWPFVIGTLIVCNLTLVCCEFSPKDVVYAVNCGGDYFKDSHGINYQSDESSSGIASDFGKQFLVFGRVSQSDSVLYQTEKYDSDTFGYDVPLDGDGDYVLVLKFSEVYFNSPGAKDVVYAVNCGGDYFKDSHGINYQSDESSSGIASDFGKQFLVFGRVSQSDSVLYQTEKYDSDTFGYDVPLDGDGDYVLVLKFSEVYFNSPGAKERSNFPPPGAPLYRNEGDLTNSNLGLPPGPRSIIWA